MTGLQPLAREPVRVAIHSGAHRRRARAVAQVLRALLREGRPSAAAPPRPRIAIERRPTSPGRRRPASRAGGARAKPAARRAARRGPGPRTCDRREAVLADQRRRSPAACAAAGRACAGISKTISAAGIGSPGATSATRASAPQQRLQRLAARIALRQRDLDPQPRELGAERSVHGAEERHAARAWLDLDASTAADAASCRHRAGNRNLRTPCGRRRQPQPRAEAIPSRPRPAGRAAAPAGRLRRRGAAPAAWPSAVEAVLRSASAQRGFRSQPGAEVEELDALVVDRPGRALDDAGAARALRAGARRAACRSSGSAATASEPAWAGPRRRRDRAARARPPELTAAPAVDIGTLQPGPLHPRRRRRLPRGARRRRPARGARRVVRDAAAPPRGSTRSSLRTAVELDRASRCPRASSPARELDSTTTSCSRSCTAASPSSTTPPSTPPSSSARAGSRSSARPGSRSAPRRSPTRWRSSWGRS